ILVYAKKKETWIPNRLPLNEKQMKYYQNPDNDERGAWNSATYTCNKSNKERPNLYYPIKNPFTNELVYPSPTAVWKYSKEQTEVYQAEGKLFWGKDGTARYPRFKKFLFEHEGVVNRTLWHYDDVNHTQGASNELKELKIAGFSTPKPSQLIKKIIQIATSNDSIILDSFAGSGTTAHAVLNINKSDNGKRKFILIEMEDYANSITAERVKRVIDGYGDDKKKVEGTGGDFSFYELGERLLLENGNLNPNASLDKIREYIWYMETKTTYVEHENNDTKYYLSQYNNTAYYFYYEKGQVTNLDNDFLAEIKTKADHYVIYADLCSVSDEKLQKYNITFKKIPRDLVRL
ncbi:MAG: site-specific DNA-methyltransferase, partial [Lachnospiraceae bacterium]|nr:site-specific DNA-methyltransferase [Lachnospiraceae bacterium]